MKGIRTIGATIAVLAFGAMGLAPGAMGLAPGATGLAPGVTGLAPGVTGLAPGVTGLAPLGGEARTTPAVRGGVAAARGGTLRIVSPKKRATVTGPKVMIEVDVKGLVLVSAGTPLKSGEGHLHFFIDVPARNVKVGAMIPLDTTSRYVHAGKEPFDRREIELTPGRHTITVVAANSGHVRLAQPKPVSVTFTMK